MPEALQQVRDDLGDNAVILNTRTLRRNNRFNLHDEARVEVTAAYDESVADAPVGESRLAASKYGIHASPTEHKASVEAADSVPIAELSPVETPSAEPPVRPVPAPAGETAAGTDQVIKRLRRLQDTVARLERKSGVVLPDELARLSERLQSVELGQDLTDKIMGQLLEDMNGKALADRREVGQRAAEVLLRMVPAPKRIKLGADRQVVAFFGASGAGKTTAVAKIAAGFTRKHKNHIVLVSTDDRRVGARDQVGTFARIIGVTLETADCEEEMQAVLAKHQQARLILVDAPGCGPQDQRELSRQEQLFTAAGVSEVHIVIDALHGLSHMLDMVEASRVFSERRLLFAKMDEVVRSGPVLSTAISSQIPVSYMTVGAQVPGDIEAGNLNELVERIIGYEPKKN